jgi:hypothetical protein
MRSLQTAGQSILLCRLQSALQIKGGEDYRTIAVMKGLVVSFEKGEDHTCTFAVVNLCNKTLQVFNFEVSAVLDEEKNWAMNEYSSIVSSRFSGLQKLDSDEIKQLMGAALKEGDLFFVRNTQTLDILTMVFEIAKDKIYIVNKKLTEFQGLACVSCGGHSECCVIDDVVAMTNFICNLERELMPMNLDIAAAEKNFMFKPQVNSFRHRVTLKTADKEQCLRFNTQTEPEDSD